MKGKGRRSGGFEVGGEVDAFGLDAVDDILFGEFAEIAFEVSQAVLQLQAFQELPRVLAFTARHERQVVSVLYLLEEDAGSAEVFM